MCREDLLQMRRARFLFALVSSLRLSCGLTQIAWDLFQMWNRLSPKNFAKKFQERLHALYEGSAYIPQETHCLPAARSCSPIPSGSSVTLAKWPCLPKATTL
jgi:hypothetical protein